MRIRIVPLLISLVAASAAVASAFLVGATLLPILKTVFTHGASPSLIGAWIAIAVGVATALTLAGSRDDRRKRRE
ncbi:MAG: hypothetical protein ABW136_05365 [Steroidobacteraceae bacterium]